MSSMYGWIHCIALRCMHISLLERSVPSLGAYYRVFLIPALTPCCGCGCCLDVMYVVEVLYNYGSERSGMVWDMGGPYHLTV